MFSRYHHMTNADLLPSWLHQLYGLRRGGHGTICNVMVISGPSEECAPVSDQSASNLPSSSALGLDSE